MDQVPLGSEVGLGPGDIVLDGDPRKEAQKLPPPRFLTDCSATIAYISATAGLLFSFANCVGHFNCFVGYAYYVAYMPLGILRMFFICAAVWRNKTSYRMPLL